MENIQFEIDSVHSDLSFITKKLERLKTSIHWLDSDLFEKDIATLQDGESFIVAYNERKIQSELHCEVLDMYVKELQKLTEEVKQLNDKAWKEFRQKEKADNTNSDQTEKVLPASNE
ncbi:DUF1474 family protein [Macrococcus armenti]|uniref:type II toxin-antitoxin system toxin TscT n=1 Tax=Macrococcus armenti TaxID=2875764 RepID=UPI001CCC1373|nr:DUF1474 family protein [Macrococcus armenti]UBH15014.1 DUF1474 family protein [Macrococcus armenti]UBH17373.1 DUF1474 family protein [Macrococcus armenti]UBH19638.1 DUF1474 family protein [Macrococcus armenti]